MEGFVKGSLDGETYELDQSDEVAKIGDIITLTDNVADTTNLDVNYVSNNTDVVTVENGKVTVVGKGSATVTASIASSFSDSVKFTTFTTGDEETMRLATNNTANTNDVYRFYGSSLTTDVKAFTDGQEKPFADATSYVEYTLVPTANKGDDDYYANFLNFSAYTETKNTRSAKAIPTALYERYKNIDWSNAYMSFWLYNGSGFTATLYGTLDTTGLDLEQTNTENHGDVITTVGSGWTKVTVSLKDYCGITSDVIATGNYNIKVWLQVIDTSVTADNLADKSWSFYMTGVEFKTPTVEEMMVGNYTAATKSLFKYFDTSLTTSVQNFGTVTAPAGVTSTSYIAYTLKTNADKSDDNYYANFINFSTANTNVTSAMSAALYEKYKNIDWTNAYMSFWLYNGSGLPTTLYGTKNDTSAEGQGATITTVATGWSKVTVSLKDYCGIASDVIATGNYNIKLWLSVTDTSVEESNYTEKSWSFYVTGFEFTNDSTAEDLIANNFTVKGTDIRRWYTTVLSSAVKLFTNEQEKPFEATSYVEYSMKATANNGSSYAGNFLNFNANLPIDEDILSQYENVTWDDAYIRFWVYNDTDYTLKIFNANDSGYATSWRTEPAARTWTKVTISLKEYYSVTQDAITNGTYDIKLYAVYSNTGCHGEVTGDYVNFAGKFYVAGFEFVSAADIA